MISVVYGDSVMGEKQKTAPQTTLVGAFLRRVAAACDTVPWHTLTSEFFDTLDELGWHRVIIAVALVLAAILPARIGLPIFLAVFVARATTMCGRLGDSQRLYVVSTLTGQCVRVYEPNDDYALWPFIELPYAFGSNESLFAIAPTSMASRVPRKLVTPRGATVFYTVVDWVRVDDAVRTLGIQTMHTLGELFDAGVDLDAVGVRILSQ